ncbi:hypothetical protein QWY75_00620 [Pontixanthobacter aestiaquae]|uniref:Phage shock protein B n=1 Tax=Pontixanthobacter aestiaquae TaxID=1509367 RepID=A0A844Z6M4_9SPHN|nr:hypothetical protein [Pontixanthobacter aestiaquae]MDN3644701.1 hypothetical protein [Pontixanthobacter aestiaquae]MXO84291.1 hypothetical protein [Pontixanthobacter aestiaquae]
MDSDLMGIFAFILILAMIVFPFAMFTHRRSNEHEERKLELLARTEEAKSGRGADGEAYRKLEKRVRVLERIATDKGTDLAQQIEHLRDLDDLDTLTAAKEKVQ